VLIPFLQYFDAVGLVTGRISDLYKITFNSQ